MSLFFAKNRYFFHEAKVPIFLVGFFQPRPKEKIDSIQSALHQNRWTGQQRPVAYVEELNPLPTKQRYNFQTLSKLR